MFEVKVVEIESGEVHSVQWCNTKEAEAIVGGYQNDPFYTVEVI